LDLVLQCPQCRSRWEDPTAWTACPQCSLPVEAKSGWLAYDHHRLLRTRYGQAYFLNQVLNQNGWLSYQLLASGSLSLEHREDVARFGRFLETQIPQGRLLDVGCGLLPLPAYLCFSEAGAHELVGLDPIRDDAFQGFRVVGCSERMPFADASFDALVFATSLDHVCDLNDTLLEARRVLRPNGRLVVWLSDRSTTWKERLMRRLASWKYRIWGLPTHIPEGQSIQIGRYVLYDNGTVLLVPPGGVDPFHSYFESPDLLLKVAKAHGLVADASERHGPNECFVSLRLEGPQ
jgi:SAM-dependent methyltransferase